MNIEDKTVVLIALELDRFTTIQYEALFIMLGNALPHEISTCKETAK